MVNILIILLLYFVLPLVVFAISKGVLIIKRECIPPLIFTPLWFIQLALISFYLPGYFGGYTSIACFVVSLFLSSALLSKFFVDKKNRSPEKGALLGLALLSIQVLLWLTMLMLAPGGAEGLHDAIFIPENPPPSAYEGVDNGLVAYKFGATLMQFIVLPMMITYYPR